MIRVLLLIGVAAALILFIRWLFSQPPRVYWQHDRFRVRY